LAFFPSKAQDLGITAPSIHKIWGFSLFVVGEEGTGKKIRNSGKRDGTRLLF
jgi:hypothetical protein